MRPVVRKGTLAAVFAVLLAAALAAQSSRHIYVRVVTFEGKLVTDMTADELEVSEDGMPRKITKVGLSTRPMRIALIVDTSSGGRYQLIDLRPALDRFIDAVPLPHEMLLVTTGHQVSVRVQPTADRKKLRDSAAGIFPDTTGSATLLMDALREVEDRFMKKATDRSPVFVIVTGDGPESSQASDQRVVNEFTQALADRDHQVHAIILSAGRSNFPLAVSTHLSQATGGRAEVIGASTALPDKLNALAESLVVNDQQLASWYEVEYASTSKEARPLVAVSISRPETRAELSMVRRLP
jgi:hypothetical protein